MDESKYESIEYIRSLIEKGKYIDEVLNKKMEEMEEMEGIGKKRGEGKKYERYLFYGYYFGDYLEVV